MTITIVAKITIREGKMEEAKAALKEIMKVVKETEPGTLEYTAHTVKDVDNEIIFVEKYKDGDAVKTHMRSLGKNMKKLSPFLEPAPPDIKTCFPIE